MLKRQTCDCSPTLQYRQCFPFPASSIFFLTCACVDCLRLQALFLLVVTGFQYCTRLRLPSISQPPPPRLPLNRRVMKPQPRSSLRFPRPLLPVVYRRGGNGTQTGADISSPVPFSSEGERVGQGAGTAHNSGRCFPPPPPPSPLTR